LKVLLTTLLMAMGMSCAGEHVEWKDVSYAAPPLPRAISLGAVQPTDVECPVSVRAVRMGATMFAAWWSVRRDSSAALVVSRSTDGGKSWTTPVIADSTDASVRGCARPAPAVAADSASGYVHVAYFVEPRSGRGIFFVHSMDGGRTFHASVPIVFGDNPAFVSVAASGDRVAVAYEDPNSAEPSVGIALSRTMGHIFEHREIVSSDNERAKQPTVELRGDTVRLWWSDHAADPRISATRTAYHEGVWR
jgi:hypothetical protein